MSPRAIACHLYEPDGAPLSAATCLLDDAPAPAAPPAAASPTVVLTALDRPGRVVERCLVGPARAVWLHLRDGTLLPGRLERVFYEPARGRSCAVRLLWPAPPGAEAPTARWRGFIRAAEARHAADAARRGESFGLHTPAELEAVARQAAA